MIWLFDRDFAKLWKKSWIDVDKCVVLVYNIQVWCADMAQLVEQLIRNEQVVGSSPTISSTAVWSAICPPIHLYGSEGFVMLAA